MTTQTPAQVIREAMAKATPSPWTGTAHHIWTRDDAVADCHAQSDTLLIVALVNSGDAIADLIEAASEQGLSEFGIAGEHDPDAMDALRVALSRVSDALVAGR